MHVQQYGVTSFDSEPIGDFEGNDGTVSASVAAPMDGGNPGRFGAHFLIVLAQDKSARRRLTISLWPRRECASTLPAPTQQPYPPQHKGRGAYGGKQKKTQAPETMHCPEDKKLFLTETVLERKYSLLMEVTSS